MKLMQLFPVLVLLLLGASCHKSESPLQTQGSRALKISFGAEVRSFDPRIGIDYPSVFAVKMLFEGLMRMNLNGEVELAIAKDYFLSDDQMTYTFTLKDTLWSNGDPLVAGDFAYTWKKIIDPEDGESLGVHNLYCIKNVRAIICGEKPLDSVGIRVIDDKTLEVELEHPTPYFLEVLSTSSLFPVNPKVDRAFPNWANEVGSSFVGNGPFCLKSHRLNDEINVVKNELYWDAEHVKLPGIRIAIISDPVTRMNLFERGELDWCGNPLSKLPLDAIEHLKRKNKLQFSKALGLYWYFLNVEAFPFHNSKLRKAFAYAIDRKSIVDFVTLGNEVPATGVLPFSLSSQSDLFFEDNIELARKLFKEGIEELDLEGEPLTITLNYADEMVHQRVAEALQQQWQKVFGLTVALEKQEWKVHYSTLQQGNFQIGGMSWQSWIRDPSYILKTFLEKSDAVNMSNWEHPEYQRLLHAAEREIDPVKRKDFFNRAETLLMNEMPVIPVYFHTKTHFNNESLKDVYISDLHDADFRFAYFKN